MTTDILALNEIVKEESQFVDRVMEEVSKVIVGQREMLEGILMGLLAGGHVLLEGVPGLAKTQAISSVARSIVLDFKRVQFTPDLLPSDLTGTMVFKPDTGEFVFQKGSVFANIVLADEINRAPAKVQSALLEVMAEKQVTVGNETHILEEPFFVLATQNPLEQEGTYPLPESQLDRFMFKILVGYPSKNEEVEIIERMSSGEQLQTSPVITQEDLFKAKSRVDMIHMSEKINHYIVDIIRATREPAEYGLHDLSDLIDTGASTRAAIKLARAAKAHAFIRGRGYVTAEDVKAVVYHTLRHRLFLSYNAEAEGITADEIIEKLLSGVEVV